MTRTKLVAVLVAPMLACAYITDTPEVQPLSGDEEFELAMVRENVAEQDEKDRERIKEMERKRQQGSFAAILGGVLLLGVGAAAIADARGSSGSSSSGSSSSDSPDEPESPGPRYYITGRIMRDRKHACRGCKVTGNGKALVTRTQVGDTTTDKEGYFKLPRKGRGDCISQLRVDHELVWEGSGWCAGKAGKTIYLSE